MFCQTLGIVVPSPCPRAPCDDCREGLEERAAIIEAEEPAETDEELRKLQHARTLEEAKRQAVEAMPVQRNLLEEGT